MKKYPDDACISAWKRSLRERKNLNVRIPALEQE
jgi:hypothetical protein